MSDLFRSIFGSCLLDSSPKSLVLLFLHVFQSFPRVLVLSLCYLSLCVVILSILVSLQCIFKMSFEYKTLIATISRPSSESSGKKTTKPEESTVGLHILVHLNLNSDHAKPVDIVSVIGDPLATTVWQINWLTGQFSVLVNMCTKRTAIFSTCG